MKDIAQIIKKARIEQGYTLHSLAAMAGLTHTVISRIESGELTYSAYSLYKVANVLGLRIALLPKTSIEIEEDDSQLYITAVIARMISMDGKELSEKLCEKGILYKKGHSYLMTDQYLEMGYAINKEVKNGYWATNLIMWSEKGKEFILQLFGDSD